MKLKPVVVDGNIGGLAINQVNSDSTSATWSALNSIELNQGKSIWIHWKWNNLQIHLIHFTQSDTLKKIWFKHYGCWIALLHRFIWCWSLYWNWRMKMAGRGSKLSVFLSSKFLVQFIFFWQALVCLSLILLLLLMPILEHFILFLCLIQIKRIVLFFW